MRNEFSKSPIESMNLYIFINLMLCIIKVCAGDGTQKGTDAILDVKKMHLSIMYGTDIRNNASVN